MTEDDPDEEAAGRESAADADGDPFADTDEDPFADIEGVELEDDPFTDLSVGEGEDPSTDFGPSDNTLFTDEGVAELDDEAVWERIEGDGTDTETTPESDAVVGPDRTAPAEDEGVETVVKKRSYCENCEHFSDPPEVSCTYPGSEIVELVDTGHFRVRNCPVVARRRSNDISSIAEGGGTTDPGLEGGDVTEPELEGGDGTEPELEGGDGTEPELEGGDGTEPELKAEEADGNADD